MKGHVMRGRVMRKVGDLSYELLQGAALAEVHLDVEVAALLPGPVLAHHVGVALQRRHRLDLVHAPARRPPVHPRSLTSRSRRCAAAPALCDPPEQEQQGPGGGDGPPLPLRLGCELHAGALHRVQLAGHLVAHPPHLQATAQNPA